MKPTIRLALAADLENVQRLNAALFAVDGPHDAHLDAAWPMGAGAEYFGGAIAGETGVCFVAEVDETIAGYLVGAMHEETVAYRPVVVAELENMLVDEQYRGFGLGSLLVEFFKSWARQNGAEAIQVSAYAGNTRAQHFYRKHGFSDYALTLEARLD